MDLELRKKSRRWSFLVDTLLPFIKTGGSPPYCCCAAVVLDSPLRMYILLTTKTTRHWTILPEASRSTTSAITSHCGTSAVVVVFQSLAFSWYFVVAERTSFTASLLVDRIAAIGIAAMG